jgi:cytochrome c biogenesis protein CcdA
MPLPIVLFVAGTVTILLPCILPLVPIVLGSSIAGRSPWRPVLTVAGMVVSFVGFTLLLLLVLSRFTWLEGDLRTSTYYLLLLVGIGFLSVSRRIALPVAALGGLLFFWERGLPVALIAAGIGATLMFTGAGLAARVQQLGNGLQKKAGNGSGRESLLTAFLIGLTMGLVWFPCAGPALGFVYSLVSDKPGGWAFFYLSMYGLGVALPLLLIGYGGQLAARSVRSLSRFSGRLEQVAGVILVFTALASHYHWLRAAETWLNTTPVATFGIELEERWFGDSIDKALIEQVIDQ